MNDYQNAIAEFLASKALTENSKSAYRYDLGQFLDQINGGIDAYRLRLYQESLSNLKVSVRRRKLSAINQFLYFLYQNKKIDHFYKLQEVAKVEKKDFSIERLDRTRFYDASNHATGQLVALLILELGLKPSEILNLKVTDIDLSFEVMTVTTAGQKRILGLPKDVLPYLGSILGNQKTYLFDKAGQPYSRQWLFVQLSHYLSTIGYADWTAQRLREQFILQEIENGTSLFDLAKKLGLKTPMTLENYYKHGH